MIRKEEALERFSQIIDLQLARVEQMKKDNDFVDYSKLDKVVIGLCGGDGIGPAITDAAANVLKFLLADEVKAGKAEFKEINGLTLENRIAKGKTIPDDVLAELKACHVILKGPTTTPEAGDGNPNLESANVAMRKELDLFANVRPVKVPEKNIDWVFFRENTEGSYAVGSLGYDVSEDLAFDFCAVTTQGSDRIARIAFEHAKKTGRTRVSAVTKANIIKTTDGKFLNICREMAKEYPGIELDSWYIDIMTAKLVDEKRRTSFQVFVLPNLYGDILTDEAAEFMGGVGTAGSANIGKRYSMFEAIHGSAPRMLAEGREIYADPCSMMRAAVMLLEHIGRMDEAKRFERALDICLYEEKKLSITGRDTGATTEQFAGYVMDTINSL